MLCTYLKFKLWKKLDIKKKDFRVLNPLNALSLLYMSVLNHNNSNTI